MESDRIRWNEKHAVKSGNGDPDAFFLKYFHRLLPGATLDMACGRGRHSVFLAKHGYQVTAVDISDVAIESTARKAAKMGVNVNCMRFDLDFLPADLFPQSFQNIVCINYRPADAILKLVPTWLVSGGCFMWCSFNELQAAKTGFPLELALHHQAFIHFYGLQLVVYERFEDHTGFRDGYLFIKS